MTDNVALSVVVLFIEGMARIGAPNPENDAREQPTRPHGASFAGYFRPVAALKRMDDFTATY
jgi:hypothetical protein